MLLMDLLMQTQKNFVQNQNISTSESITYTHSVHGSLGVVLVFIDTSNYNAKDGDKRLNEIELANVVLAHNGTEVEPTKLDTFSYDSKEWNVRWWRKSSGMYQIIADSEKRNKASSRSFQ